MFRNLKSTARKFCTPPKTAETKGSLLERYSKLLQEKPLLTTAWSSAIIAGVGDIGCQLIIEADRPFNFRRCCTMSFLGGTLIGPTLYFWYNRLAGIVGGIASRPGMLRQLATVGNGVGLRVILDQAFFAPVFVGVFFTALAIVEFRPETIATTLARDWPGAVVTNWQMWIPAQCVNFFFTPLKYQVLFANFIALFWNAYLSWICHREYSEIDTNGDGALSKEELQLVGVDEVDFNKLDTNKDGKVDLDEYKRANQKSLSK